MKICQNIFSNFCVQSTLLSCAGVFLKMFENFSVFFFNFLQQLLINEGAAQNLFGALIRSCKVVVLLGSESMIPTP